MATYTPNLNFKKPSTGEKYDVVADLNDAKDKIDNHVGGVVGQINAINITLAQKADQNDLNVTDGRIDNLIATAGDGTVPSELTDIRVGADAVTYPTAGAAVRDQFSAVNAQLAENAITVKQVNFADEVKSVNKLDTSKLSIGYLSLSGLQNDANFRTSDFIPVGIGNVHYPFDVELGSNNNIYYYDVNKNYISRSLGTADANSIFRTVSISGSSIKFIRFSFHVNKLSSAMFTFIDPYPASYEMFKDDIIPDERWSFTTKQKAEIEALKKTNPLTGKKISFNGDSISAGAGFAGGYGKIIAEENSMIYENRSVSGATITAGVLASDGISNRHWICRDIDNMMPDADYIILEGGINDATLAVPMGVKQGEWETTFDDTTFIGALESMFYKAITRYPGKKIGFVLTHFGNSTLTTYYPKVREICQKWGIPYIDLFYDMPTLRYITSLKNLYTANADGVHPNEAGYRAYYVPKITAWLETL